MEKIFEAKVVAVGGQANLMLDDANMIILFGQEAPDDLAEYCYKIDNKELKGNISVGGEVAINQQHFTITMIGGVVEQNLKELGHITISFDGEKEKTLPGTLHVKPTRKVEIGKNSVIQIFG